VIKQSAASPSLLVHRGRAVVFDTPEAYHAVAGDPDLDVSADDILVIRGAGPRGYPGMPEVANVPLPAKLLKSGVSDMVRICDGRMSGTGYGTVVLHVSPESAAGGPIGLARTGDMITLDVPARTLTLEVDADELARRREAFVPPPRPRSGYAWLYTEHVLQAEDGADFDFLRGSRGAGVPRDSH
jgi:dihydroxy-acid dehydratase